MSEHHISALIDSEALDENVDLVFSPEMQARWTEYHQIGEILRSVRAEIPVQPSDNFQRRFAAAFEAEAPHVGAARGISRLTRSVRPFMHQVWSHIVHPMRA